MPPIARLRRAILVATLPIAAGMAAAIPAMPAAAADAATFDLQATTRVIGLPRPFSLELGLDTDGGPGPTALSIRLVSRTRTAGASLLWYALKSTFSCGARLARCAVETGDTMGSYGRVSLRFRATGPTRVVTSGCFGGAGGSHLVQRSRSGVLAGTFRLRTGYAWYGTIRNRAGSAHRVALRIPATVWKTTTGASCPPTKDCSPRLVLQPVGSSVIVSRLAGPTGPGELVTFGYHASAEPGVVLGHMIAVRGKGPSLLAVSDDPDPLVGATVKVPKNPWLTGTLTFESHAPLVSADDDGCAAQTRQGSLISTLVATLPGLPAQAIATSGAELHRIVP